MASVLSSTSASDLATLLRTVDFAAKKHSTQRRKDKEATPYINHPIGVANLLTESGVTDLPTIQAALLHDTVGRLSSLASSQNLKPLRWYQVEDTETTPEELDRHFGAEVRKIVMECTDDKTLPKARRKELQVLTAGKKSDAAKNVKLADKLYNCTDLARSPPIGWTVQRIQEYFQWAETVTSQCASANPTLADRLEELYGTATFSVDGKTYKAHPSMQ